MSAPIWPALPVPLLPLLAAAVAWSAAWWLAAGAVARLIDAEWLSPPVIALALPGLLGPALVAWWFLRRAWAAPERSAFWRGVIDPRGIAPAWWLAILLVGTGPKLVAFAYGLAAGAVSAEVEPETVAALAFIVAFALAAGLAEEPLWRGVARDSAQAMLHPVMAALVVAVVWRAWHLPLFFIPETYQAGLEAASLEVWLFFLTPLVQSIMLVWLVNAMRGRVFAAVLAHALTNVAGETLPDTLATGVVEFIVVVLASVLLVAVTRGSLGLAGEARAQPCSGPRR